MRFLRFFLTKWKKLFLLICPSGHSVIWLWWFFSTKPEATKPVPDHLSAPSTQGRQTDEVEDKQRKDFISFKRALPKIRPRIGDFSKDKKDHTFNDYPLAFNKAQDYKPLLSKEGNYYDPLPSNKINDINPLSTNRIDDHKFQSSNKINDYNSQSTNNENKYNPLSSNNVNHNDPLSSHEVNDYNPLLSNKVNHNNPLSSREVNDYNRLSSNQEKENKRVQSRDQYPGLWKSHGVERYHGNNVDQSESS